MVSAFLARHQTRSPLVLLRPSFLHVREPPSAARAKIRNALELLLDPLGGLTDGDVDLVVGDAEVTIVGVRYSGGSSHAVSVRGKNVKMSDTRSCTGKIGSASACV